MVRTKQPSTVEAEKRQITSSTYGILIFPGTPPPTLCTPMRKDLRIKHRRTTLRKFYSITKPL
jgi:hypothetical protein